MNNYVLWENDEFVIKTPYNPHQPYSEGIHLIVKPINEPTTSWEDPTLSGKTFEIAATACQVIEDLKLSPWFNLQANGNWGLLPDAQKFFHIHIYGRNKTGSWGKPITLPEAPGTYKNDPMPEEDRVTLTNALNKRFRVSS